jgi:hypothetical protein
VGELAAAHAMFIFDVADDRLDYGASFHLLFECWRDAALLVLDKDVVGVRVGGIVAAISGIGQNFLI